MRDEPEPSGPAPVKPRTTLSVRQYIVLLALIAGLPFAGISTFIADRLARAQREIDVRTASVVAASLAAQIAVEIEKNAVVDPTRVRSILQGPNERPGWSRAVLDQSGRVVATTGEAASSALRQASANGVTAAAREGTMSVAAPAARGWSVVLTAPRSVLDAPYWRTLGTVLLAELVCAAGCGTLVTSIMRRFAASGRVLQNAAVAIASDRRVIAEPTGVREYDQTVAAFASASLLLRLRADERSRAEQSLAKHSTEQGLLYRFADTIYRAQSPQQLYDAALETIMSALKCNRASISLLDEQGKARFVAWRGLSERYRTAVDGQSPWAVDDPAPAPVSYDYIGFADVPASLISDVTEEGVYALAFAPLLARGKLAGKFVAYYDAPHRFAQAELDLAVILARQLSLALDRLSTEHRLGDFSPPIDVDQKRV